MPATAGRVRMPANNRVHSSAALQTHGIWQSAIGYDPYAPKKDDSNSSRNQTAAIDGGNAYASFQGLLALARISGSKADEARGACKKCGHVGHLTFQCRNFLYLKEKYPEDIQAEVLKEDITAGNEVESESSDSDVDSEIEKIIAERSGKKKVTRKGRKLKKRKSDEDGSFDSYYEERKKRGRSKTRSNKNRIISGSDYENESGRKRGRSKKRTSRKRGISDSDDKNGSRRKRSGRSKKRSSTSRFSDDGNEKKRRDRN